MTRRSMMTRIGRRLSVSPSTTPRRSLESISSRIFPTEWMPPGNEGDNGMNQPSSTGQEGTRSGEGRPSKPPLHRKRPRPPSSSSLATSSVSSPMPWSGRRGPPLVDSSPAGWRDISRKEPTASSSVLSGRAATVGWNPLAAPSIAARNDPNCRALVRCLEQGQLGEAVEALEKMGTEGVHLDVPLAVRLVNACTQVKAWHWVEGIARADGCPPDIRLYLHIFQACAIGGKWQLATTLIRDIMPSKNVLSTVEAYQLAIIACGHSKESAEALSLFEEMMQKDVFALVRGMDPQASLRRFLQVIANADAWDAAQAILLRIMEERPAPASSSWKAVSKRRSSDGGRIRPPLPSWVEIDAAMVEGVTEACQRAIRRSRRQNEHEMIKHIATVACDVSRACRTNGVDLHQKTWTSMIQIASTAKKRRDVTQMEEAMKGGLGGSNDRLDASQLSGLQSCLRRSDWEGARMLMKRIKEAHEKPPSSEALISTMLMCALQGKLEHEALDILEGWLGRDTTFNPSSMTRALAVRACLGLGVGGEGEDQNLGEHRLASLLLQLEGRGGVGGMGRSSAMCSAAFESMQKDGNIQEALDLLKMMRRLQIQRTLQSMSSLISLCKFKGRPLEAIRLLEEMQAQDDVRPSIQCYQSAGEAAIKAGLVDAALDLLQEMEKRGMTAPESLCTVVMGEVARRGEWEKATGILKILRSMRVIPSLILYTMAIDACGDEGEWKTALKLLDDMERDGIRPNHYSFSTAMKSCARAGEWEPAHELFKKMNSRGIKINEVTYTAMLDAYAKAGLWEEAGECLLSMKERDLCASTPHYTAVIDACSRAGAYQAALNWLDEMHKANVPVNGKTYSAAMHACGRGGAWYEACRLLMEMLTREGEEKPTGVSYMLAIDACGRANQWPVACYIWDLMTICNPAERSRAVVNSLIYAMMMEDPACDFLAARYYSLAYDAGIVTHWHARFWEVMDLHGFSLPMAKVAIDHMMSEMLQDQWKVFRSKNKGEQQQAGEQEEKERERRIARRPLRNYTYDPHTDTLTIVTGHGKKRGAGMSPLQEYVTKIFSSFDPPIATEKMPTNIGRLKVDASDMMAYTKKQIEHRLVQEKEKKNRKNTKEVLWRRIG